MIKSLTFAILCLMISNAYAQPALHTYTLNGTINADTGSIMLYSISADAYYPFKSSMVTTIWKGKFIFTDSINYPTAFTLVKRDEPSYLSGMFYIDPGQQTITCSIDSLRKVPKISNKTMTEWQDKYVKRFAGIRNEIQRQSEIKDSIRKACNKNVPPDISFALKHKTDSLAHDYNLQLLEYARDNPDSYVVLWSLIYMMRGGYDSMYSSVYNQLSNSVKTTHTGKLLAEKLRAAELIAVGKTFPQMVLNNMEDSAIILPVFNKKNGYTLIDFWFSHCQPCKRQFPALKKMYDKYKGDGFEIVGISIDQANAINDWKKTIKDMRMDWLQYRDKDETNANRFSIEAYPTNFLLDKNGSIVKRNIEPEELEKLLAKDSKPE